MGGDSWDAALLEADVQHLAAENRRKKRKQKASPRSKTAERLAAKHPKLRAMGPRAEKRRKVGKTAGVRAWLCSQR